MKNALLILTLAGFAMTANAQDPENLTAQESEYSDVTDYNRWSVEISGGVHKPSRFFADGYYTNTPSFGQGSLGVRYMFNDRFGLKTDFGYNAIEGDEGSLPFKSNYYRGSLQGVVNLGNVLRFSDWTQTFGLLVHAGGGYSMLSPKEPFETNGNDNMLHLIGGLTGMVRLGNRVALTGDVSAIGNVRQTLTWDGTEVSNVRGVNGFLVNASVGLTFYLGKNEKHADWYPKEDMLIERVTVLEERVDKIETDLIDSDMDGVPDYLDREPNTISGLTVDSKGVAVDKNNDGIPDEIETSLDSRFVNEEDYVPGSGGMGVEDLLNNGYVNVYFKFNSDEPETYSLEAINYLIKYMNENPGKNAELIGYADEIGDPGYNAALSERRAKHVYDILIAAGVAESRLSYSGGGEDASVDKDSSPARQLVRRVTFRLK